MRPQLPVTLLSVVLLALPAVAQPRWDLVTPSEEARDRAVPHRPGPAGVPASPLIQLLRPDISKPIQNPTTIEVRFSAAPGAAINMQTFKATYGWVGLNITSRLLKHARKTRDTLLAQNVDLPPGDHKVTLSISTTSGATAARTFRFSVAQ
jgi:hypothetical protein